MTTAEEKPDFPTILRDLEIACYNFSKNPTRRTQEGIDEFKNSKHAIPASRYVLEHSNKPDVHFHTVAALRDAVLKKWPTLPIEDVTEIRNYLLDYSISNIPILLEMPSVRLQATRTIVAMIKRGWLSPTLQETPQTEQINEAIFKQIGALLSSNNLPVREVGMHICTELVSEFSSDSDSTNMNLPWEFHRITKQCFEKSHLQHIFIFLLQNVEQILGLNEEEQRHTKNLFLMCLELLDKILSWPFLEDRMLSDSEWSSPCLTLEPGEKWRQLLVESRGVLELYFKLYLACRNDSELAHKVIQGLVQLASLHGKIFETEEQQKFYLQNFLQGTFLIMFSNQTPSPSEILNIAQVMHRLALNFPSEMFQRVTLDPKIFFENLTKFTCNVLYQTKKEEEVNRESYLNTFDELLEAWVLFVKNPDDNKVEFFQHFCGTVVQFYVETRLEIARESAHGSAQAESSKYYLSFSEQLESVAQLSRISVGKTTALLIQLLGDRIGQIAQALASQAPPPREILNQIQWLILIAGHLLADTPTENNDTLNLHTLGSVPPSVPPTLGSVPPSVPPALGSLPPSISHTIGSVPPTINRFSSKCQKNQDPVVALIGAIFEVVDFENTCIQNNKTSIWSVPLAETVVWFMNRWCHAYLHGKAEDLSPNLASAYGNVVASSVIEFFVKKIATNLLLWTGELDLVEETCNLLFTFSKKNIPYTTLQPLQAWGDLLAAHTTSDHHLTNLPGRVQRKLIQALINMQLGDDPTQRLQYFTQVVLPVKENLASLLRHVDNSAIQNLVNQLERARGIVRASNPNTAGHVWGFCSELLRPLMETFRSHKEFHEVVQLILGLWLDMAKYLLCHLLDENKELFLAGSMDLFIAFQEAGFGKPRRRRQTRQQDEEQQAKATKILKAVHAISIQNHSKASRTAYYGTSVVIGALTPELLQFPKLTKIFYMVIESLCKHHTDKLPLIPDTLFKGILGAIDTALGHPDFETGSIKSALESLFYILTYHFNLKNNGGDAFGNKKELFLPFITKILEFLISANVFHVDLIQATTNVFFYLMRFDMRAYQVVVDKIISSQPPPLQAEAAQAFAAFQATTEKLSLVDVGAFSIYFKTFLMVYRGLVKKK